MKLFYFIIALQIVSVALANIPREPKNMAVVRGSNMSMSCDFGLELQSISWYHRAVQKNGETSSSLEPMNTGNKAHATFSEFELGGSVPGQTLFLNNTQLRHAGVYQCATKGKKLTAQLIVLDLEPRCNFSILSPQLLLSCVVQYKGLWIPHMEWLGSIGSHEYRRSLPTCTEINHINGSALNLSLAINSTSSSKYIFKLNFKDTSCSKTITSANNTPDYEYIWESSNLPYGPSNVTISPLKITYNSDEHITCVADSNPVPQYEWRNMKNQTIGYGQNLALANLTTHEEPYFLWCRAVNKLFNTSADSAAIIISIQTRLHTNDGSGFQLIHMCVIIATAMATAVFTSGAMIGVRKCKRHRKSRSDSKKKHLRPGISHSSSTSQSITNIDGLAVLEVQPQITDIQQSIEISVPLHLSYEDLDVVRCSSTIQTNNKQEPRIKTDLFDKPSSDTGSIGGDSDLSSGSSSTTKLGHRYQDLLERSPVVPSAYGRLKQTNKEQETQSSMSSSSSEEKMRGSPMYMNIMSK